jgi:AraC-like DNA-binding protein
VAIGPQLLLDAGVDPAGVALAAGLDPGWFDDPGVTISLVQMGRYLQECVHATRDETFALRLGLAEGAGALYTVGYLARHSTDVRTALSTLKTYVHHFGGELSLESSRGRAWFEYRFLFPALDGAGLVSEGGVGIGVALLRQLCGRNWRPDEIRISRPRPAQPARWRQCLQAPVQFGSDSNLVVFAERWLDHPVERADAELRRIMQAQVLALEAEHGADYPSRVCSALRACLLTGDVSVRQVASRLATSPRTLRRRLAAGHTSFDELRDQTRLETACHLLENSEASITRIADLLGYAHSSALSRAFRRWTKLTPREWRVRMTGAGQ